MTSQARDTDPCPPPWDDEPTQPSSRDLAGALDLLVAEDEDGALVALEVLP